MSRIIHYGKTTTPPQDIFDIRQEWSWANAAVWLMNQQSIGAYCLIPVMFYDKRFAGQPGEKQWGQGSARYVNNVGSSNKLGKKAVRADGPLGKAASGRHKFQLEFA